MQIQSSGKGTSVNVALPIDEKQIARDEWKITTDSPSQKA